MSIVNWDSVLSKAQRCMASSSKRQMVQKRIDNYMLGADSVSSTAKAPRTPSEAAAKFIEVLQNEIESHLASGNNYADGGLGETAVSALKQLKQSSTVRIGNQRYSVGIWFQDMHRKSLAPDKYSGIDNLAALLNSGYDAGHTVYGIWNGHGDERIASLTKRGGAHFIEQAIKDFMANYADEYGVIAIEVDEAYK